MNDLGMDSLDTVEVVMAFEDEFGKDLGSVTQQTPITTCLPIAELSYFIRPLCGYVSLCVGASNIVYGSSASS